MGPAAATYLLERERELADVESAIGRSRDGGQLLLIAGSAGIGKTRLLTETSELARDAGLRVLAACGREMERGFPFGVVRQLLEQPLRTADDDTRDAWLAGAAGLAREVFDAAGAPDVAGEDATYARLHGLYWFVANLAADKPLMLAVDDLHWVDEPSLKFLTFLSARVEQLPVLLAAATRPAEPGASVLVAELLAEPTATVVTPTPLSDDAVAAWIREALGETADRAFCSACRATTTGNPQLLMELIRAISAEGIAPTANEVQRVTELGPQGVSRLVLLRLARLGEPALRLAHALAILGDTARVSDAAQLAGLDDATANKVAADLVRSEVLVRDLSFAHPIVRTAIYEDIPAPERSAVHAEAARVLAARDAAPLEIAPHLLVTTPTGDATAVATLRAAARAALVLGDAQVAVAYLERALEEPPDDAERADVLAELGHAQARMASPLAIATLKQAIAITPDDTTAAERGLELGRVLKMDSLDDAVDVLRDAQTRLDGSNHALQEQIKVELLGCGVLGLSARAKLRDEFERLSAPGGNATSLLDRFTLVTLAFEAGVAGTTADDVAALADRAIRDGDLPSDWILGGHALGLAATAFVFAERYDVAEAICTRALESERRRGSALGGIVWLGTLAWLRQRRGQLAAAEADADAILEFAAGLGIQSGVQSLALSPLALVAIERAAPDAELVRLMDAIERLPDRDATPYGQVMYAHARLRAARGDTRGALDEMLATGERELSWGLRNPSVNPWRSGAALLHAELGETEEARALAAEEVELARAFGAPRALGMALRAAGLVGPDEQRAETLREALAVLETSQADLERARTLVDLGAAIRRTGERKAAREPLRAGLDLAARCGATALIDRARDELMTVGVRPTRTALDGSAALTPAERRVAVLAAQGSTNRDIAQVLFVTEKTVETHLSHVYSKLGIRSRRDIARAMESST